MGAGVVFVVFVEFVEFIEFVELIGNHRSNGLNTLQEIKVAGVDAGRHLI
jgi:hypothetical protein